MKTSANFLLFFALAFFGLGLSSAISQTDKKPFQTKEFLVTSAPVLEAELSGAAISVKGGSGNQVVIRCFLKKDGNYLAASDSEAKEFLEDFNLEISQNGNTITLVAKQKSSSGWSWKNRPGLSFEISVPEKISTEIRTSGGSVSLDGVQGTQDIASSGGSISVKNSKGKVETQSSGGSLHLSQFEGDVEAQTSGGSVKVENLKGNIQAKSSGGGISLSQIFGGIEASTSGGSIRAELAEITQNMNFQSSGGSIQITVPASAKFNLDIRGGGISSQLINFQGTTTKNQISGKVNGGGPSLNMSSSGGSIRISQAD